MIKLGYPPMTDKVEVDESYYGGVHKGKRGRGAEGKTPVFGMVQRNGKLEARKVRNVRRETLLPIVDANVEKGTQVYSDEFNVCNALPAMGYQHKSVPHAQEIYVLGDAHTNTIEGFWSQSKNGIRGVYHHVSDKYLQKYLDEYTFRYNHRDDVRPMFLSFLTRVKPATPGA